MTQQAYACDTKCPASGAHMRGSAYNIATNEGGEHPHYKLLPSYNDGFTVGGKPEKSSISPHPFTASVVTYLTTCSAPVKGK
jgi:hypothetical protein